MSVKDFRAISKHNLILISNGFDLSQNDTGVVKIISRSIKCLEMIFSKSFGYAVRSILYIALEHENKQMIQSEEIAGILHIPRHFASKILKNLVKHDIIASVKGPSGGFTVNSKTLQTTLMDIYAITDDVQTFSNCALRFNECNNENPCPLHNPMLIIRDELKQLLTSTTINGLLKDDGKDILKSIITTDNIQPILNL